jgi:hypothetical protein
VRPLETCRGRSAWHAKREVTETWETRRSPDAPTAGANREGAFNDKEKAPRQLRESDRSIVVGREPAKGPTPPHRCTGNQRRKNDGSKLVTFPAALRVVVKSPVRENRPPGSVRGAPGNRRPYRDPSPQKTGPASVGA